jgi:hypothetical protein
MQRNPGAKTIEDELFKALHAAGAISDANNDEHGYIKVQAWCCLSLPASLLWPAFPGVHKTESWPAPAWRSSARHSQSWALQTRHKSHRRG